MRKIITLISAALLCLSASTATAAPTNHLKKSPAKKELRAARAAQSVRAGQAFHAPEETVEIAELELNYPNETAVAKDYSRNVEYFMADYNGLAHGDDYGAATKVYFDGNKVYIPNPIYGWWSDGSCLVGELQDDKVVITLPQLIEENLYPDYDNDPDGELGLMAGYRYLVYNLSYSVDGETERFTMAEDQTVTFSVTETGLVQDGDTWLGCVVAESAVDDNGEAGYKLSWNYCADAHIELTEVTEQPLTMPEDATLDAWVFRAGDATHLVYAAIDGSDIYVKGVYDAMPEAVIKGTFDGQKAVFPSDQFMGEHLSSEHWSYFIAANYILYPAEDEWSDDEYDLTALEALELTYDADAKTLTAEEGQAAVFSTIPGDKIYYIDVYTDPSLTWQDTSTPMVPADPEILSYENNFDDYGFYTYDYILPEESVDGRFLDVKNCYYNLILDGEPYEIEFYNWDTEKTEVYTDIPYDYEDFTNICNFGNYFEAYVYADGFDKFGIQVFYKNADGTVTNSKIVYCLNASIDKVAASDAAVVDAKYYDVSGRLVSADARGLVIGVYKMSDGQVKVVKRVK